MVKQVYKNVSSNQDVSTLVGEEVSAEKAWWLPGNRPWVSGKVIILHLTWRQVIHSQVEIPRGVVDVSFRIQGSRG